MGRASRHEARRSGGNGLNPAKQYTRRQTLLLGASVVFGAAGLAGTGRVIRSAPAPLNPAPSTQAIVSTPAATPVPSRFEAELVESYRQRFAVLGALPVLRIDVPPDPNAAEVELPYAFARAAFEAVSPRTHQGRHLSALGGFLTFHEGLAGSSAALDAYNPYRYLNDALYRPAAERFAERLAEPAGLFAATVTTWVVFPDALIDRYDAFPMVESGDPNFPSVRVLVPSPEKEQAGEITRHTYRLASELANAEGTAGEGTVTERLSAIAPRLGLLRFAMGM